MVTPLIAERDVPLDAAVLTDATEAATEIARFDATMGAEIAPFAAVLLRSESAASSKIEKLSASARAIAAAEIGERGSSNATEIIGNVHAMTAAIALADNISVDTICRMHHALLELTHPHIAGQLRTAQVWIGGGDYGPQGAPFVAPHHERVHAALDDLVTFMDRINIPVLVHAAIGHAQFETIHPFVDGNGRTGRALVHAFLRHAALTRTVTVPISAGLLVDTDRYFAALAAYRHGHLEPIVEAFTSASYAAIANGSVLVEDIKTIRAAWRDTLTARADSRSWDVADLLLRQPVLNAAYLAHELNVDPDNVHRLVEPLTAAGIVVAGTNYKRGRTWRAPDVLRALDAFAVRAGRRSLATAQRRPVGARTTDAGTPGTHAGRPLPVATSKG